MLGLEARIQRFFICLFFICVFLLWEKVLTIVSLNHEAGVVRKKRLIRGRKRQPWPFWSWTAFGMRRQWSAFLPSSPLRQSLKRRDTVLKHTDLWGPPRAKACLPALFWGLWKENTAFASTSIQLQPRKPRVPLVQGL